VCVRLRPSLDKRVVAALAVVLFRVRLDQIQPVPHGDLLVLCRRAVPPRVVVHLSGPLVGPPVPAVSCQGMAAGAGVSGRRFTDRRQKGGVRQGALSSSAEGPRSGLRPRAFRHSGQA
jgi:hypothetical protein